MHRITDEWKTAKEAWKAEHPNETLKEKKLLYIKGLIDKLPWEDKVEQKNEGWEPKNEGWEPNEEEKSCLNYTIQNQTEKQLFESSKKLVCHFCQKIFNRYDNLRRHISVCKLNMAPKGSLSQSVALNESPRQKSLTCSFCGLVCSKKYNLNRHIIKCVQQKKGDPDLEIARLKEIIEQQESNYQYQKKELEVELLKKDLKYKDELLKQKDETIKIAKESKQVIHNTTNKTINYLDKSDSTVFNIGGYILTCKKSYKLQ